MIMQATKSNRYLPRLARNMRQYYELYLMIIPVLAFFLIFHYGPMYGAQIAFKQYTMYDGIFGSRWVGLQHFQAFFKSYYFFRLFRNTVLLNAFSVLFAFPAPILLALLVNEVRANQFKRVVQTITYMPHFISIVVICGMLHDMLAARGIINTVLSFFGVPPTSYLLQPSAFRTIYIGSDIWRNVGWGSIVYLAAISGIDPQLYEAATIDGAGRARQMLNVTIPSIAPTIIIMLILRIGQMMNVSFEKILLLYNQLTYETADVISTFVYRKGMLEMDFSYSTAVNLFNSVLNFMLLIMANAISRKASETSLW